MGGKSVSRARAFRQHLGQPLLRCLNSGIHAVAMCWRKGIGIHADARCAACRPRLTAAQGPRVEQRAIVARTSPKSHSKSKQKREQKPHALRRGRVRVSYPREIKTKPMRRKRITPKSATSKDVDTTF
jgi:hypothetical protein